VLTVHAARSGVWLLFFLVTPAAVGAHVRAPRMRLLAPVLVALLGVTAIAVARGPGSAGATARLIDRTVAAAHGAPVLAEDSLAEQVALAGGRVWLSNPIDAFGRRDQSVYLDWLTGKPKGAAALTRPIGWVLVRRGSPADRLVRRTGSFKPFASDPETVLYARSSATHSQD
jgi:hypothetical protein